MSNRIPSGLPPAQGIGKPEEVIEAGTQAGIQEEQLQQDIFSAVTTPDALRKASMIHQGFSLLTYFGRSLPPRTAAEVDKDIYWFKLSCLSGDSESIKMFVRRVPEEVKELAESRDISAEEVSEAGVKAGIPEDQIQEHVSGSLRCRYFNKLIQLREVNEGTREVSEGTEIAFVKEVSEAGVKAGIPKNQIQNQISFARSFSAFRKT